MITRKLGNYHDVERLFIAFGELGEYVGSYLNEMRARQVGPCDYVVVLVLVNIIVIVSVNRP